MQAIEAPTHCPACDSVLEFIAPQLFCRNASCSAQKQKGLEHFAKTLKIKGLGPAAIAKLQLEDFDQIYSLSEEEIAVALGSEKVASKLYAEIENSRSAPLELVLPALGIPLIGNTAARKLSDTVTSLFEINADTCSSAGLGPKATENLLTWLHKDYYAFYDGLLPFDFKFSSSQKEERVTKGIVCISGKLKSFSTKAEATKALEEAGYEVKSSITKAVTILVNESGVESAKTKKARESGVIIVENILNLLGE